MKSEPLFTIENLECSYNGIDTVLAIHKLTFHKGKITAVLGASGAGKSTILETMGLMHRGNCQLSGIMEEKTIQRA
jgi:ABC-type cobalamin/Fe3+-siderophores transport system ATPase subunit